jgi:hypothetical protein
MYFLKPNDPSMWGRHKKIKKEGFLKKVHFYLSHVRVISRSQTQVSERSQKYLHYFACVTEISARNKKRTRAQESERKR